MWTLFCVGSNFWQELQRQTAARVDKKILKTRNYLNLGPDNPLEEMRSAGSSSVIDLKIFMTKVKILIVDKV
jgi:hypothetical protein